MEIVYIMASGGQKVFCYTHFLYISILWGHKKVNKLSSEKKVLLSKIVPEEILKIKYCIVEKKLKEKEKLNVFIKKEHNFY